MRYASHVPCAMSGIVKPSDQPQAVSILENCQAVLELRQSVGAASCREKALREYKVRE